MDLQHSGGTRCAECEQRDPPGRIAVTRRKFVGWGVKGGLGVTALAGGLVGFTPTAAEAANPCIPGTRENISSLICEHACIGPCSTNYSPCTFNSSYAPFICFCGNRCGPPRARATCNCSIFGPNYCCCRAC